MFSVKIQNKKSMVLGDHPRWSQVVPVKKLPKKFHIFMSCMTIEERLNGEWGMGNGEWGMGKWEMGK